MTDKNKIYLDRIVKLLVDTTDIVPISKDEQTKWDDVKYRLFLPFLNMVWVTPYAFKISSKFTNIEIVYAFELYVMDHFGVSTWDESDYIWDKYKKTIMDIIGDVAKRGYHD